MYNTLSTITHCLTSAFVIGYAAWLAPRLYRQLRQGRGLTATSRKQPDTDHNDSPQQARQYIDALLAELNTQGDWSESDDGRMVHFNYQDGHFNIELSNDNTTGRIMFLYFYDTDVERLDAIRIVVNKCNLNSSLCRMVYTVKDDDAQVNVHLFCPIRIGRHTTARQLAEALDEIFGWRNAFYRHIAQQETLQHTGGLTDDPEKADAENGHIKALLDGQLVARQPFASSQYFVPTMQPTISMLMTHVLGMERFTPVSLTVCVEGQAPKRYVQGEALEEASGDDLLSKLGSLFGKDDGAPAAPAPQDGDTHANEQPAAEEEEKMPLQSYSLLTPFVDADDHLLPHAQHATLCLTISDEGGRRRQVDIIIQRATSTKSTVYLRVNAILNAPDDSQLAPIEFGFAQPVTRSLLIGYDRMPPEQQDAKLRYLWKEAVEAHRQGQPMPTDESGHPVVYQPEQMLFDSIYWGSSLFHQKRFAECIEPLYFAYQRLNEKVYLMTGDDDDTMGPYLSVCRMLGFAYAELHLYDRAIFYIEIIAMGPPRLTEHDEFLHLLLSSHDTRLVPVISNLEHDLLNRLGDYRHPGDDDDDDSDDDTGDSPYSQMVCLLGIVRLYKAHIMADRGQCDEAVEVLQSVPDIKQLAQRLQEEKKHLDECKAQGKDKATKKKGKNKKW